MRNIIEHIFEHLGGPTAIARGTGYPVQTVHSWTEEPAEIPPWRRPALLDLARRENKLDGLSDEARAYLASTKRTARKAA